MTPAEPKPDPAPPEAAWVVDCRSPLPAPGSYKMAGRCNNCQSLVLGEFTVGREAVSGLLGTDCPACGFPRVHWERLATTVEAAEIVAVLGE